MRLSDLPAVAGAGWRFLGSPQVTNTLLVLILLAVAQPRYFVAWVPRGIRR